MRANVFGNLDDNNFTANKNVTKKKRENDFFTLWHRAGSRGEPNAPDFSSKMLLVHEPGGPHRYSRLSLLVVPQSRAKTFGDGTFT